MNGFKEIEVLIALARGHGYKATELSESLGMPPSTIYNILYRMANEDYVMKTSDGHWIITGRGLDFLKQLHKKLDELLEGTKE